jgi:peptidoglycan hydrolase FlgJ
MAIAPPSDIVMDVVNAADPTSVQEAQAKLKASSAMHAAARLSRQGNGFSTQVASLDDILPGSDTSSQKISSKDNRTPETYRKFEAMVLQNFIKEMLPDEGSEVYGEGTAGEMWKGMLADQLADNMAKSGGIGIADKLLRGSHYDSGLTSKDRAELKGYSNNLATTIVDQHQRNVLAAFMPGADETKNS